MANSQTAKLGDSFEPGREVRLGLVLYGGVSLAIYINGVVREFFRASRGQGVYTLLKLLTDSDFVVDIVSGSSAGGINGILLGYSLCNNKEFAGFEGLWRQLGDISRLMRDPDRDPSHCPSLLDSEGYYQTQLASEFRDLKPVEENPHERVTPIRELDLFVTGTDIHGDISTVFDDSGHPIDVKNHRAVFQLKHRAGRTADFSPEVVNGSTRDPEVVYQALAKLSRITSAFPAAFSPVFVDEEDARSYTVDGKLQRWGLLRRPAYFIDGGVLNNKPFTSTLRAIFYRTAEREVERRLLYVEPDPERFQRDDHPVEPNFLGEITSALVSIPGYQSIGADLQELNQHNSKVQQYNAVVGAVSKAPGRAEAAAKREGLDGYNQSRLVNLRDRAIEGVLNKNGRRIQFTPRQRQAAERLVAACESADSNPDVLRSFDVYMRLRRLFDLTYELSKQLGPREVQRLLAAVNYLIGVLDIIRAAMEDLVDRADFHWEQDFQSEQMTAQQASELASEVWRRVGNAYKQLLMPDLLFHLRKDLLARARQEPGAPEDPATSLNHQLRARMDLVIKDVNQHQAAAGKDLDLAGWHGMLDETDEIERALLDDLAVGKARPAKERYELFPTLDRYLYPVELVSGLTSKDIILLTRVSPLDAQRGFSKREMARKLAGDQLHHFGGFFKRSWRANDILWGRLDSLCQLVECVFTRSRLEKALETGAPQRWLQDGSQPCHPEKLFAGAGQAGRALGQWLNDLFDRRTQQAALDQFEKYRELLIEAAQWKILEEELPEVTKAAILEQVEWNLFSIPPEKRDAASPPPFIPHSGKFDPTVATLAAERSAAQEIDAKKAKNAGAQRPIDTGLGQYFHEEYRVGSEELQRDLPQPVLLEIYARGALLVRNCVLSSLGPLGGRIKKNRLYTLLVDAPMRLFHGWVAWWRRSPAGFRSRERLLAAVSAVTLVLAVLGRDTLLYDNNQHLALLPLAILILAPTAVLAVQGYLLLQRKPRWKLLVQLAASAGVLALLVLFAVWVQAVYSSALEFARDRHMSAWIAVAVLCIPLLLIAAVLWIEARMRAMFRARVADREEVRIALLDMEPSAFERIQRAFPVECVSAPASAAAAARSPATAVDKLLRAVWGWARVRKTERRRLEALIREIDRDALPNVRAGQLKFALAHYFSPEETAKIRDAMDREEVRIALGKMSQQAFERIQDAFQVLRVNYLDRKTAADNLLLAVWGQTPVQNGERKRLEALIRQSNSEALPIVWRSQNGSLFRTAKKAHRLARVERCMRAMHPAAL